MQAPVVVMSKYPQRGPKNLSITLIFDEQTRNPATDKSAGKRNFLISQLQKRKLI